MKIQDSVLIEARRLYALGFAIHWLHPKSKRPVESGWTTGPRRPWKYLQKTYRKGYNVGVRLGTPSKFKTGYLAVVDIDVKAKNPKYQREALNAAKILLNGSRKVTVLSGRGNGSRHYYCVTEKPFKPFNAAVSPTKVKVYMPSSERPSKLEREKLTKEEIEKGVRIRNAWEISLMSEGRQVVLPPSIHPDSGEAYRWGLELSKASDLPLLDVSTVLPITSVRPNAPGTVKPEETRLEGFTVTPVDLSGLTLSPEVLSGITDGTGVTDRSGYLLKASTALLSQGLTQNEVLTVLTDPKNFLGTVGYEHAMTKSRRRAAEWVYRYTVKRVSLERSADVFKGVDVVSRKLPPSELNTQTTEFEMERNWRSELVRDKQGRPAKLINNVILILNEHVGTHIVRRDEFAYRDSYSQDTPWGGKKGHAVSDDDVDEVQSWLGKTFGFEPPKNTVESALVVIARQSAYDPVKNLLNGLPAWDGVSRLDTWLSANFEATGNSEYLAQVFRKWMVAMVMRVLEPGAKFDWMPIFEGIQGIGKSSFGRLLVGDKYFLDWLPNLAEKDAALSLQGMWGVELGELSQFRQSQLEAIKSFITRTVDKVRPPYGRRLIESPRRCVFFGTTNRKKYLIDETGNRRFKPVEVGNLNFKALERDRVQLFAEAKHLWDSRIEYERSLELTGVARAFEREIHQEKMVEDDSHSMEESMRNFIEKIETGNGPKFDLQNFKILELFEGAGPLGGWRKENRNLQFAAKMLKRLGGKVHKIRGFYHWKLPENLEGAGYPCPPAPTIKVE